MSRSDVSWEQNPLLNLSNDQIEAHSKEWAFVVLLFTAPETDASIEEFLFNKTKWTLNCTNLIEKHHPIDAIQQDGLYLTFLFNEPKAALFSALTLLELHQHNFHVGAGVGVGYDFDHFKCLELIRLKCALPFGNTVEVQITSALMSATTLPFGIGAFQCSALLAQRTGMNYWILKDYRSTLE